MTDATRARLAALLDLVWHPRGSSIKMFIFLDKLGCYTLFHHIKHIVFVTNKIFSGFLEEIPSIVKKFLQHGWRGSRFFCVSGLVDLLVGWLIGNCLPYMEAANTKKLRSNTLVLKHL